MDSKQQGLPRGGRGGTEKVLGAKMVGKSPDLAPHPHHLGLVQRQVPGPVVLVVSGTRTVHLQAATQSWSHCWGLGKVPGEML